MAWLNGNLDHKRLRYRAGIYIIQPGSLVLEDIENELDSSDLKAIKHFVDFKKNLIEKKNKIKDFKLLSDSELFEIVSTLVYTANQVGDYARLCGGFYQGYYKLEDP